MSVTVKVTSDFICPWCHIGKARLKRAIETLPSEIEISVEFLPFELNPGMPKGGIDRKTYRTRKFGSWERSLAMDAHTVAVSAEDGVEFHYDLMTRTANTFDAHRLSWFAAREGLQAAVVDGILKAYFVQGRDIGNEEVLSELAVDAGLERDCVAALLAGDDGTEEVRTLEAAAYRNNIHGVPHFDIEGAIVHGAQAAENLRRAILGVHAQKVRAAG
jgi:predicted DsbA family dithiol-disulfide isomerase